MRIIKRKHLPEFDESLHQELANSGWVPLREPGSIAVAIILSVPFMVTNLFISIMVIRIFSTISLEEFGFTPDSFSITINLGVIIALFLLLIIHEVLHLIFIPNFIRSSKTYVGPAIFGGFVYTEEEIVKSRFILITVVPFLVISIMLPIILGYFGVLPSPVKLLILLNAIASSVDMLTGFKFKMDTYKELAELLTGLGFAVLCFTINAVWPKAKVLILKTVCGTWWMISAHVFSF